MIRTYKVSFIDKIYHTAKYQGLFAEIAKRLNITTIATNALHNGDVIEFDAINVIIRIL